MEGVAKFFLHCGSSAETVNFDPRIVFPLRALLFCAQGL